MLAKKVRGSVEKKLRLITMINFIQKTWTIAPISPGEELQNFSKSADFLYPGVFFCYGKHEYEGIF
jgi:hypothetical protein